MAEDQHDRYISTSLNYCFNLSGVSTRIQNMGNKTCRDGNPKCGISRDSRPQARSTLGCLKSAQTGDIIETMLELICRRN